MNNRLSFQSVMSLLSVVSSGVRSATCWADYKKANNLLDMEDDE